VREVCGEAGGTKLSAQHTFLYGKGNEHHELGTGLFLQAVKRADFVCDRMSYIIKEVAGVISLF
jgi:hypothetical protein